MTTNLFDTGKEITISKRELRNAVRPFYYATFECEEPWKPFIEYSKREIEEFVNQEVEGLLLFLRSKGIKITD